MSSSNGSPSSVTATGTTSAARLAAADAESSALESVQIATLTA